MYHQSCAQEVMHQYEISLLSMDELTDYAGIDGMCEDIIKPIFIEILDLFPTVNQSQRINCVMERFNKYMKEDEHNMPKSFVGARLY